MEKEINKRIGYVSGVREERGEADLVTAMVENSRRGDEERKE